MARQTHIQYIDDIDGTVLGDEVHIIEFAFDGRDYSIDLSEENADAFRELMAPYVEAGHVLSPARRKPARKASARGAAGNTKAIRQWARESGYDISERGRIPAEILAAYNDAH